MASTDKTHRRTIQTPACDRCTQGVMDATNPHLLGTCGCSCHRVASTDKTPLERRVESRVKAAELHETLAARWYDEDVPELQAEVVRLRQRLDHYEQGHGGPFAYCDDETCKKSRWEEMADG